MASLVVDNLIQISLLKRDSYTNSSISLNLQGKTSFLKIKDSTLYVLNVFVQLFECWLGYFLDFFMSAFFKIDFVKKFFQEHYQSVKQFGFRSGPTFGRS